MKHNAQHQEEAVQGGMSWGRGEAVAIDAASPLIVLRRLYLYHEYS